MPRYRTYGRLDDPHAQDGDMAFVRMVSRINPEQLQPGEVAYSQNGRMDNDRTWQPRKGVEVFSPALDLDNSVPILNTATTVLPFNLADGVVNAVYGSGYWTDPLTGTPYLVVATNAKAIFIDAADNTVSAEVLWPDGLTVAEPVEMLQALDKLIVFRDGATAWVLQNGYAAFGYVTIASAERTSGVVDVETDIDHGYATGDYVKVSQLGGYTDDPNGFFTITVTGAKTFTYLDSGVDETFTTGAQRNCTLTFDSVASGTYSALAVDNSSNNASVASGVVTITETSHGRTTGDILTIYGADSSGLQEGDRYEIVVLTTDTYKFLAEIPDGTYSLTLGAKQPVSGGYIHMPNAAWGIYHEGRLILPYERALTVGTSRDELIFSDIFDIDTYDPILSQLRFASGSADYIVGVAPLVNDRLIVFCRQSVHICQGVCGSLADLTQNEITREVGCVARSSIVEVGGSIMWLSDQGVYSITYGQELNLVADKLPLSEPIADYLRGINWNYAHNAVAVYADNRYFLAVPYGDSTVNNVVLVYNFLNQGWESIDTYPAAFNIVNMLTVPVRGRNRIFFVNESGAAHLGDSQYGFDRIEVTAGYNQQLPVLGKLITRRYTLGTMDIKRFNRAITQAESPKPTVSDNLPSDITATTSDTVSGTLAVSYIMQDPDSPQVDSEVFSIAAGEDYGIRSTVRRRGYGLQMIYQTESAKVRGVTVEGILSGRSEIDRS